MSRGEKISCTVVAVLLLSAISLGLWVNTTHAGRATWNLWFGSVQKVDDATNYNTRKEVEDSELKATLIDNYMNLQRIKSASDKEKEVEYQIKAVKAKLEAFGIVTEDLDIH